MKIEAVPNLVRDGKRLHQIVATFGKYGLAPWLSNVKADWLQKHFQATDGQQISALHQGARMREAFTELGTTFIKLGQILSTRPDLVGPEITDELAKLQSGTPADPPDVVRQILEAELGAAPEELFLEFDDCAAASASIGQVHFARLKDGSEVVVKVQHPGIEGKIRSDLEILKRLAELAEKYSGQARQYRPTDTIEEFSRTLMAELDFSRERKNLEKEHRKLDSVTNRLVLGVLTAALFVGSAMVLSSSVPPLIQGVSVVGVVGCLVSLSMGFRLVRAIQRSGNIESKS